MAKAVKAYSGFGPVKMPKAGMKKSAATPRTGKGNFGYPFKRGGGQKVN